MQKSWLPSSGGDQGEMASGRLASASIDDLFAVPNDAPIEIFIDLIRYIRTEQGRSRCGAGRVRCHSGGADS